MDVSHGGTQRRPDGLVGAGTSGTLPASKGPDRSRRDEWSEGGVLSLLEVYESKWLLRNRAKLKWSDWEDIAQSVSVRCSGTKAVKTPNQCKNKIESMKKRYRSESAATQHSNSCSSWQFYTRMDGLLKGTTGCCTQPKAEIETTEVQALPPKVVVDLELEGNMQDSNQDDGSNTLPNNVVVNNGNNGNNEHKESRGLGSDLSTPRSKVAANAGEAAEEYGSPIKRKKGFGSEVAESIRFLAHSILKIEQVRMEMYKDTERMRVEAEIRRGEMELRRTEIIANTQLQIAKLLSRSSKGKNVKYESSSMRVKPHEPPTRG